MVGFEPTTSCSQSIRDNRTTLHPEDYFFVVIFFLFSQCISHKLQTTIINITKKLYFVGTSLKKKYPNKTAYKNSIYLNGDKKVASANENARKK